MASTPDGLDALAAALSGESYPTDRAGLYYSVGDLMLEDGDGHRVPVRDLLARVDGDDFAEALVALNAILAAASHPPVGRSYLERAAETSPRSSLEGEHQAPVSGVDQLIDSVERGP